MPATLIPGLFSPDKRNLIIPKGFGMILRDDDTRFRHIGNAPNVVFTPTATTLEHFTSMEGIKLKDETITLTQGGTVKLTLEEATMHNLALMVMGTVDDSDLTDVVIDIFSRESVVAEFKFFATNSKGPRWYWDFKQITFTPSGDINMVADAYGNMVLTGSVESVDGDFGTVTLKPPVNTAGLAPENVLTPAIVGSDPSVVGDEIGIESAWVGASSFTYRWLRDAVAIGGATEKTYTLVSGDNSHSITAEVTATNSQGSTILTSPAIVPGTTF